MAPRWAKAAKPNAQLARDLVGGLSVSRTLYSLRGAVGSLWVPKPFALSRSVVTKHTAQSAAGGRASRLYVLLKALQ